MPIETPFMKVSMENWDSARFERPLTPEERRFINGRSPNLVSWLTSLKRALSERAPEVEGLRHWNPFDHFVLLLAHCLQPEHDIYFQELTRETSASETPYDGLNRQIEHLGLHPWKILIRRMDLIRQAKRESNPVREHAKRLWGERLPSVDEQLLELESLPELKDLLKILYAIVLSIAGTDFHRRYLLIDGLTTYPPTKQRRHFLS